ncbi:MAG: ATP-dependent zinc metalloprotease FtsH [Myxococcales bacterium]|nr:ATP-dependent zinc metalloprotease FtsH [Myxococcales bacterium]
MLNKSKLIHIIYAIVAIASILMIGRYFSEGAVKVLPYSEFQTLLEKKGIKEVMISQDEIRGVLTKPIDGKTHFVTNRVDLELVKLLDKHGIKYTGRKESTTWSLLLSWMLPLFIFLGLWFFFIRRIARGGGAAGGMMAIGKSKAKIYMETDTRVTFGDVAGVDEAKAELIEIIAFLKEPASYGRLGARMPKGILLVGPPGTGKTLLARAVAGEAKVPFFSISGSEFVELFVGVGAARVRDLFEQARREAPCIIFVDELDALGRARGIGPMSGGHDEKEQTLNQLLAELDGFDPSGGIIMIGATNRPEVLDPALLRAGRFDRQILVDRPGREGRAAILKVHVRNVALSRDVDTEVVASMTPGFSGADLANLVNEAALMATRRNANAVTMDDFTSALERIVAGLEKKNRLLNLREREIVAYHEMGHALTSAALPGADIVHKVSIIPRGIGSLGYTIQRPTEDRFVMTRAELESRLMVLLGGRAAERLIFDHLSTGAADDLNKVTDIARSMATRYGMVAELGHVTYDREPSTFLQTHEPFMQKQYSEDTAREIDCAVRQIVDAAFERTLDILRRNRSTLEKGAELLLEQETLGEDELSSLFDEVLREAPEPTSNPDATPSPTTG